MLPGVAAAVGCAMLFNFNFNFDFGANYEEAADVSLAAGAFIDRERQCGDYSR